jgi:predicted RND superfamily exporter protein
MWAELVVRYRWPVLIVSLLATLGMARAMKDLKVENGPDAVFSVGSEARVLLDEYRRNFGQDELFLVLAEGDVFSLDYLSKLKALHDDLSGIDVALKDKKTAPAAEAAAKAPAVDPDLAGFGDTGDSWSGEQGGNIFEDVTSLINARRTRFVGGALQVKGLLEESWPSAHELPALKKEVMADDTLVGRFIGKAGRHSVIALRTGIMSEADSARVSAAISEKLHKHEAGGFHLQLAGSPAFNAAITAMMDENLGRLFMSAIAIVILALALTFRHVLGVLAPLGVVIQSVIWTFGTMALTDVPLTMIGTILPTFLICMGVCDSVHLQSAYRDARIAGLEGGDAVKRAVQSTLRPVMFTSATTAFGLFGLNFAYLDAVKHLGRSGAVGVMVAFVYSITFLPALLSFNKKGTFGSARGGSLITAIDRFLGWARGVALEGQPHAARRRAWTIVGAMSVLTALLLAGMTLLRVEHNPLIWFPEKHPLREAYGAMDGHVGGTSDLVLIVKSNQPEGVKSRELLERLQTVEKDVKQFVSEQHREPIVSGAASILDPIRETWRAVHENDPAAYRIPDSDRGVVDMATLFESSAPSQLRQLATLDMSNAVMLFRVRWLDATEYGPLLDYVRSRVDTLVGSLAQVSITGTFASNISIVNNVLQDLARSFSSSFLVIALLMIILMRSIPLGLIAMVPNVLPILWILGLMGYANVPLTIGNLLIASIGLGIGVDDTVHVLHHFRDAWRKHGDVEQALTETMETSGRPLVVNSLVLISGFSIFMTASMVNIVHFGLLIAAIIGCALIAEIALTPALLRIMYKTKRREEVAVATTFIDGQVEATHGH